MSHAASQRSEEEHLQEEIEYANAEYTRLGSSSINEEFLAKYTRPRDMWDWRQRVSSLLGPVAGKKLLDYGCGQGEEAAYFAKMGAKVTAIDVSPVGLDVGRRRAVANGLSIDFRNMNCLNTEFSDASFDIVHGSGILHHLGLEASLKEVHRLLVNGGIGIFMEPLQSGKASEYAKTLISNRMPSKVGLTPVTSGEENLRLDEIHAQAKNWSAMQVFPYRLTYRLRKLLIPSALWERSLKLDFWLLQHFPSLQRYSGAAIILVRK